MTNDSLLWPLRLPQRGLGTTFCEEASKPLMTSVSLVQSPRAGWVRLVLMKSILYTVKQSEKGMGYRLKGQSHEIFELWFYSYGQIRGTYIRLVNFDCSNISCHES